MGVSTDRALWKAETEGVELLETTIGDIFDQRVSEAPGREALVYSYPEIGIDLRLSYQDFQAQVNQLAKGLIALGVEHGDKVAVLAPNLPEWPTLEFSLAKIGAVLATVNTGYRKAELEYLLRNGDINTLFTVGSYRQNSYLQSLHELVPELATHRDPANTPLQAAALPLLKRVVLIGDEPDPACMAYAEIMALGNQSDDSELKRRQSSVGPQDIAQIQYTSGTTGHPKGVMLTHHSTLNNALLTARRAGFEDAERFLTCMPLFHTAGCVLNVLGTLLSSGTLIMGIYFDARKMLELIHHERATIINMVPTMLIALLNDHLFQEGKFDTRSVTKMITGGTSIPIILIDEAHRKIGGNPTVVLGLTETSPIVCQTLADDSFALKSSTVGIPLPHTSVRIADSTTGELVGFNEPGEIQVKGYLVMKGYYLMPEKTAETIDAQGWLRTGDLGTMDERGYVRVIGRLKDMIIRGGENIYPVEIEEFLLRHAEIEQAAVVAVPDDYMGEEAAAVLRLAKGSILDSEQVRQYCRNNISRHKVPKHFIFVDEFPLTASGKIQKNELRSQVRDRLKSESR